MRGGAFIVLALYVALAACFDSSPELTKEDELLFEAVMCSFTGIEDNMRDSYGLTEWKKESTANGIRFMMISENGIGYSNPEINKKIRQSKYVQYVYLLTRKEPCVFRFEDFNEFSKGDGDTEFARIEGDGNNILNSGTFNFANAHKFEFAERDWGRPVIVIEGPKVMCQEEAGYCKNEWTSENSGMAYYTRFAGDEAIERRGRAIAVVKKACPGKAF
jgi:hypothetical protein